MSLPLPRYTQVGLDAYLAHAPVLLPLPPGQPDTWSCALHMFGPTLLMAKDDTGNTQVMDANFLREVLRNLGRPTRDDEQESLLLVTPIPSGSPAIEAVKPLLNSDTYATRWKAALVLGHLGNATAVPALLAKLDDSDNDVRRGVVEALGRLGDPSVIPALAGRAWGDSDSSVDAARVGALVRLLDWEAVAKHVNEDEDEDAYLLVRAILEAEDAGSIESIVNIIDKGDEHLIRAAAMYLQGRPELCAVHAEALVRPLIEGGSANPKSAALAGLGGDDAVPPLAEVLETGGWQERMYAAMALGYTGSEAAVDALTPALDDDDNDVRREAALALAALGRVTPAVEAKLASEKSTEYDYPERALAFADRVKALEPLGMLAGTVPADLRALTSLISSGPSARERGFMALLLALTEPELVHALLDAMARDDSRDVPIELRRFAAAGLLLTGYPPSTLGALHRILLCHEGSVHGGVKGSVDNLHDYVEQLMVVASKDGDWPMRIDALRLLQILDASDELTDLLKNISRHDPDVDCRKQALSMLPTEWKVPGVAETLALAVIATRQEGNAKAQAFRDLTENNPEVGLLLADRYLTGDDRDLARSAAQIVGQAAQPGQIRELVDSAMGRLTTGSWIAREAAADLLGYLHADRVDDGLLEEIGDALRDRVENDDDSDVQNAATAALGRLGFAS